MTYDRSVAALLKDSTTQTRAQADALYTTSASTSLRVPASDLVAVAGTPTRVVVNGNPAWSLPDGATSGVAYAKNQLIPSNWNTIGIAVYYAVSANGGGVIRFNTPFGYWEEGAGGLQQAVAANDTQNINVANSRVFTITTGRGANSWWGTNRWVGAGVERIGADAADTYAGSVYVLGLVITRTT